MPGQSSLLADIVRKIKGSLENRRDNLRPVVKLSLEEYQVLEKNIDNNPKFLCENLNTRVRYVQTLICQQIIKECVLDLITIFKSKNSQSECPRKSMNTLLVWCANI